MNVFGPPNLQQCDLAGRWLQARAPRSRHPWLPGASSRRPVISRIQHAGGGATDRVLVRIVQDKDRPHAVGEQEHRHTETKAFEHRHHSQRAPWLRAFILGANDGLVSVAALMLGVTGASEDLRTLRLPGISAWIAGALSMAAGEYISVAAQRDAEEADVQKERDAQAMGPEVQQHELEELTEIYVNRGLSKELAMRVAEELTAKDVIRAHARDELGIDLDDMANPLQAAVVGCTAFTLGAAVPLLAGLFVQGWRYRLVSVTAASTLGLAVLGYTGAALGGARVLVGGARVMVGGLLAMVFSYGIGYGFARMAG